MIPRYWDSFSLLAVPLLTETAQIYASITVIILSWIDYMNDKSQYLRSILCFRGLHVYSYIDASLSVHRSYTHW